MVNRIELRSQQFPVNDIVAYCIGCVRAFTSKGKHNYYLPDLICGQGAEIINDTLDDYHHKLNEYIEKH